MLFHLLIVDVVSAFEKIKKLLNFKITKTVDDGILEIKKAIDSNIFNDCVASFALHCFIMLWLLPCGAAGAKVKSDKSWKSISLYGVFGACALFAHHAKKKRKHDPKRIRN